MYMHLPIWSLCCMCVVVAVWVCMHVVTKMCLLLCVHTRHLTPAIIHVSASENKAWEYKQLSAK